MFPRLTPYDPLYYTELESVKPYSLVVGGPDADVELQ